MLDIVNWLPQFHSISNYINIPTTGRKITGLGGQCYANRFACGLCGCLCPCQPHHLIYTVRTLSNSALIRFVTVGNLYVHGSLILFARRRNERRKKRKPIEIRQQILNNIVPMMRTKKHKNSNQSHS